MTKNENEQRSNKIYRNKKGVPLLTHPFFVRPQGLEPWTH